MPERVNYSNSDRRCRVRQRNTDAVSVVLGTQTAQLYALLFDRRSDLLAEPPSISFTHVASEVERGDVFGSVVLSPAPADDTPVILADQAALEAWDEAQRRVDAIVAAGVDAERDALDFIPEE